MRKHPSVPPVVPASVPAAELETIATEDGRALVVEHGITGNRYRLGDRVAYATDAGTLIDGVLVWGPQPTHVYLPAGGRRRERTVMAAPRFVLRELASGTPRRVYFQRVGGLWAIEDPGRAVVVRSERGEALEVAQVVGPLLCDPVAEVPWARLSEELHLGRLALWAQVWGKIGATAADRALAEQVRAAAFAVIDLPRATLAAVRQHPALAGRSLGQWEAWMQREWRARSPAVAPWGSAR